MPVIGCLLLIVLPLLGLAGGGFVGGAEGAKWGAGAGFAAAMVVLGAGSYAFIKGIRGR
ncbi:hypothetical protein V474_10990 [Novosphingobium barchaimii LL02]|uniref:Uncharacterized protein n=1 Tax=Novosphingobium barchaimii LL02 TaxID=1114963 RepID=A0A0J8AZZ1_9SPHN|nr:hypothetical protein [Novosphingobium barchaimii]KMS59715.1 hypothetical protein V474_10990 [Novosphingobium barchaimii LL02]